MKWWSKRKLYTQIAICVVIGIIVGLVFGKDASVIKPVGDIFLRLLKVLIVPLTFLSILAGITKMGDSRAMGTVGGRAIAYYIGTSLFSAIAGIIIALIIQPGKGAKNLISASKSVEKPDYNFVDQVVQWFPENIIESMSETNMLQIIIFAVLAGIALLTLGEKVSGLTKLVNEGSDLMIKITEFVLLLAPYGILSLVADTVGTLGGDMIKAAGKFILTDFIALLLVLCIVYPLLLKFLMKKNPLRFYKNVSPALLVAASTTSSAGTLPVSMKVAEENLGIPEKIYGFTLPFGATINMDGFAVALGSISVFAANLYGVNITFELILQFVFLGLALSIGAAGVKGAGIVMSSVLLSTLGFPLTLVPVLAAIWPILDIGHTPTNIAGDLTGTTYVATKLNMIDDKTYNQDNKMRSTSHSKKNTQAM